MKKKLSIFLLVTCISLLAYARATFRFEVPAVDAKNIYFDFSFPVGSCQIYPQTQAIPIQISGQMDEENLNNVKFIYEPKGADYLVTFGLYNQVKLSMSEIEKSYMNKNWQVMLSPDKNFGLKLAYGWGQSDVNLSGLPVNMIDLHTGHANVKLHYDNQVANPIAMKSFQAQVDFGTLEINNLDLANASDFSSEVGVGTLSISFSEKLHRNCQVNVNVGAGAFYVKLPTKENGIIIKMDDSFVSTVSIPEGFQKKDDCYVNQAYLNKSYSHLVTFDVSVSMGKVKFE